MKPTECLKFTNDVNLPMMSTYFSIDTKGEVETFPHHLPHCSNYSEEQFSLLNSVNIIHTSIL